MNIKLIFTCIVLHDDYDGALDGHAPVIDILTLCIDALEDVCKNWDQLVFKNNFIYYTDKEEANNIVLILKNFLKKIDI